MTQVHTLSRSAAMPVFDLRRMAAGPRADDAFLGDRLAVSHHPEWEFWRSTLAGDRSGRFASRACHLVVIVLAGSLTLRDETHETRLEAGDSALIAAGTSFDWQGSGAAQWIVNGYRDATTRNGAVPGISRVDPDAPQTASPPPAERLLVSAPPECTKLELAGAGDGCWSAGLWTATPYERVPVRYGYYEMMHLHAGAVTVFDETGAATTFGAGDVFLVPEGVSAGWRSTTDVRKLWSIFTPART